MAWYGLMDMSILVHVQKNLYYFWSVCNSRITVWTIGANDLNAWKFQRSYWTTLTVKEGPKTSSRSLIRRHLSSEKKIDLFAFLAAFNIVISEKEVEMGNLKETKALILDLPATSFAFCAKCGPSMSQILVLKMDIDNTSPYIMMM